MLNKILVLLATCLALFSLTAHAESNEPTNFKATAAGGVCAKQPTSLKELVEQQLMVSEKDGVYSIETACGNRFWNVSFSGVPRTLSVRYMQGGFAVVGMTFPPVYATVNIKHCAAADEKIGMQIPIRVSLRLFPDQLDALSAVLRKSTEKKIRMDATVVMPITQDYPHSRDEALQKIEEMLDPLIHAWTIDFVPM